MIVQQYKTYTINMKLKTILFTLLIITGNAYANLYDDAMTLYDNKNYKAALNEFEPLAYIGNRKAQNMTGYMYHHGEGVKKDFNKATKFYGMAAENGAALSQYNLGVLYNDRLKNGKLALYWFTKAEQNGDKDSARHLMYLYIDGDIGVDKDLSKAKYWAQKAYKNGRASESTFSKKIIDMYWKENELWKH
jgi:TPR repeat protein